MSNHEQFEKVDQRDYITKPADLLQVTNEDMEMFLKQQRTSKHFASAVEQQGDSITGELVGPPKGTYPTLELVGDETTPSAKSLVEKASFAASAKPDVIDDIKDWFFGLKDKPAQDAKTLASLLVPENGKIETASVLYFLDKYHKEPSKMAELLEGLKKLGFQVTTERTANGDTKYTIKTGGGKPLITVGYHGEQRMYHKVGLE